MNHVILIGRLTRDPDVRYSQGAEPMCIARYTLAVDRRMSKAAKEGGEQSADFINCVAFGKSGEFAEKYLTKGTKIAVAGRIQTGSFTNKDGQKIYTTDVVVEEHEFCESRGQAAEAGQSAPQYANAPVAQPTQPQMAQAQPMQNQQNYQQMYQQPFNPQQYQQQYQQMPAGYPQSTPVGPNGQLPGFMQIPDGVDDPNLPFS